MNKLNCWEAKRCGREPGGNKVNEFGICPSATEKKTDQLNSGKNGGRSCWAISGTFCNSEIQGSHASKILNCLNCDFYKQVRVEEGENYSNSSVILNKLAAR